MKTSMLPLLFTLAITTYLSPNLNAQDEGRPEYVAITRTHWNFDLPVSDDLQDNWLKNEQEYLEKVTKKNEHIMSTVMLNHYYTGDNTEVLLISTYKSWEDIEMAQDRTEELEMAAWPDKEARNKFLNMMDSYYVHQHADEIYRTIPGAKRPAGAMDSSKVVYIQKQYRAYPEDGSRDEFEALRMEYVQKVIHKNPHVLAYYPLTHAWGADNRELINIYVVDSLCDVEEMNHATADLVKAGWPDENARKEFMKKYNKYLSGMHGDYIYTSVPEVSK